MKIMKFSIASHVYILLLLHSILIVQLINCEHPHKNSNITLTAKDGSIYTYNPSPPKALRLGKGSYGLAIIGERIENGVSTRVAMKIEKICQNKIPMLHNERRMYKILSGKPGIPHFFDYFLNNHEKAVLVIELLGKSLDSLPKSKKKFSIKTTMMIGLQILDIIETIHEKGILYNDIKPNNFAIGREDKSKIYILDFGLSKFYMKGGNHVQQKHDVIVGPGTPRYMSIYAHTHNVLSRRDDIESIAYMLIEFLNGRLWGTDSAGEVLHRKSTYSIKKIAGHVCPMAMVEFLEYARQLKFMEKPDYGHLKGILQNELTKNNLINDGHFDWMTDTADTETEAVHSSMPETNLVHEKSTSTHSNELLPQTHSFVARDSQIETANEMPPTNVLAPKNSIPNILSNQHFNNPLAVTHPHVQTVLLGQPMMSLTQPVINSIPVVSNGLPTHFVIHPNTQPPRHLTPVLIQ